MQIELTERSYLILPVEIAEKYFPTDNMVVLPRGRELWLLPVNNKASGGLLMKRRNSKGDRSVLLVEIVPDEPPGFYAARWEEAAGAMIINLKVQ
jgi:hypothetical protein